MLSTVSIMPGIDSRAPERQDTNSGFVVEPNLAPISFSIFAMAAATGLAQFGRILAVVGVVVGADVGADGKAGRDGQADLGHFGQVGAPLPPRTSRIPASPSVPEGPNE